MIPDMNNLILEHKFCLTIKDQTPFRFRPFLKVMLVDGTEVVVLDEMGYENSRLKYSALDAETGHMRIVFEGEGLMVLGDVRKTLSQGHKLNESVRPLSLIQLGGERVVILGHAFGHCWMAYRCQDAKIVQVNLRSHFQVLMLDIRSEQAQILSDLLND